MKSTRQMQAGNKVPPEVSRLSLNSGQPLIREEAQGHHDDHHG